jgi:hypothetical protein
LCDDGVDEPQWILRAFGDERRCCRPNLMVRSHEADWQALMGEVLLFPEGEHDDFFDGLQTMMDGAINYSNWFRIVVL